MKTSKQDNYYLEREGDDFFRRNYAGKKAPELRAAKQVILDHIKGSGVAFSKVLEYGCCYGDILAYFKRNGDAEECVGVEASQEAIDYGASLYDCDVRFVHGVIADNDVNRDPANAQHFDLVIVDDVFGWVSRETVMQSVANIDAMIADGGSLFIRDFYPDKRVRNRNHHVENDDVFNFKLPGSHASLFLASGMYEVVSQRVFYDDIGMSTAYVCDNQFNYRWVDVVLRKSVIDYFDESKKL